MKQLSKKILAVCLVSIIILPTFITILDALFHQHDHFHCNAEKECHIHHKHSHCPISSFEFSLFTLDKPKLKKQKNIYHNKYEILYSFVYYNKHTNCSFLLRAPPSLY